MKIALFDIGGTTIKHWIYDSERPFDCTGYSQQHTPASLGGDAVMTCVEEILLFESDLDAISVCTAGQVNPCEGSVIFSTRNIPGYTGMQIKKRLKNRFQVPVFVENDVNAAALGEAYSGAGRQFSNFLCLTYGTGIGGAIFINRQIFYGSSFSSGEFGHLITHAGGIECTCGHKGCYEAYASTLALISTIEKETELLLNGKEIFALLSRNPKIQHIVNQWVREVITGLASLIHIFNPQAVILGGGIMEQDYVIKSIKEEILNWLMPSYQTTSIRKTDLGNIAGLIGMLHIASEQLKHTFVLEYAHEK